MSYLPSDDFISICYECEFDIPKIQQKLKQLKVGVAKPAIIRERIANLRKRGLLPFESGNSTPQGTVLKGITTTYDTYGNIVRQTIRSDVPKDIVFSAIESAIAELTTALPIQPNISSPTSVLADDLATLYISNDLHMGALMWDKESGSDWNVDIASQTIQAAYDYLFSCSPNSKVGIIVDLGDILEVDDFKNMTPKSGNILAVDSRYPKILRAGYEALIYAVNKALTKHELVYFYNIAGNHDPSSGIAIREIMRVAFSNNSRVIINDSPSNIKYHQHGTTLLGFAHGDGMKIAAAGEVMAHDCQSIFSSTRHRFFHFGHNHKDSVIDTRLCRAESHRNLAPLNHWAFDHGYRSGLGTMKSITYHTINGEVSRSIYTLPNS